MMRAAIYEKFGPPDVVRIADVETPAPAPDEIMIQIKAAAVSSADWRLRSAQFPDGFAFIGKLVLGRKPKKKILGSELSGIVAAVGKDAHGWKIGDEVFAYPGIALGAHAEYICIKATGNVVQKPANITFEQAASMCFGGCTALSFLDRCGGLRPGSKIMVVGASGSVGSAFVQIAKQQSDHITGVCSSANEAWVRDLGANCVICYDKEQFPSADDVKYDVIVDTAGSLGMQQGLKMLAPGGKLLLVFASFKDTLKSLFYKNVFAGPASEKLDHVKQLANMAAAGAYRPIVSEVFSFDDIVRAYQVVDSGRKRGNVVVTMEKQRPASR